MKITIIDKKDITLKVENSTIKFDDIKLPFRLSDTIIISSNVVVNSRDLIKITDNDINIIFVNTFANKSSILTSTKSKNCDLKLKQYGALSKRVSISKYIVSEKIKRHAFNLKANDIAVDMEPYLKKLDSCTDIQNILGVEGSFSKEYFHHYFTLFSKRLHNSKRTKRPPLDPINALLSFFYSLLYNIITIKLLGFGFDPCISYLHVPFRSHQALSSDILELFRDQVNQFVKVIIDEKIVTLQDFSKKGGVYLKYEGRKNLYRPLKDLWEGLEPHINSEISKLRAIL